MMNRIEPRRSRASTNTDRYRALSALCLASLLPGWVEPAVTGQTIVVPGRLAETDGDTTSQTPAGDVANGTRVMIVVDRSQFGALDGPAYLTQFAYRPNAVPGPSGPRSTDFKIFASTTSSELSMLSTRFRENVGPDARLVFDGPLSLESADLPGPGDTRQFDLRLPLTTPFLYDPAAGNLVVELQIGASRGDAFSWDAVSSDPAIRYLFDPGSSTAPEGRFGVAPVLQFTFEPAPRVTIRTSRVDVCWESVSNATYRVEWSTQPASGTWLPLVECVRATNDVACVTDAVVAGEPRRFYRVLRSECTAP